jgi:hypothetical protein
MDQRGKLQELVKKIKKIKKIPPGAWMFVTVA